MLVEPRHTLFPRSRLITRNIVLIRNADKAAEARINVNRFVRRNTHRFITNSRLDYELLLVEARNSSDTIRDTGLRITIRINSPRYYHDDPRSPWNTISHRHIYTGFNYYRASGASRLQIATTDIMHHAMRLGNYHW